MASTRVFLNTVVFFLGCSVVSCSVQDKAVDEVEGQTEDCLTVKYCPRTATVCTDGALVQKVLADLLGRLGRTEQVVQAQAELIGTLTEKTASVEAELSELKQQTDDAVNQTSKLCCSELLTQSDDLASKIKDDLCGTSPSLGHIFHTTSPAGSYKYDYEEAVQACSEQNASLASYHQLYEAWQDGLELCSCGWLSDGTSRYPMQTGKHGCGDGRKINTCAWAPNTWNAWCFKNLDICD
ncbi:HAPLN2 [Branchiostoma lanceolatum]|uniref:HAPLN2 protein n=1 Tax=Branchiostoma lanceolatum TaxID=7740 RepID=A0A8J9ZGU6_BRALA|nr:HAPLN2 [Branchiostoma lanceolatum]